MKKAFVITGLLVGCFALPMTAYATTTDSTAQVSQQTSTTASTTTQTSTTATATTQTASQSPRRVRRVVEPVKPLHKVDRQAYNVSCSPTKTFAPSNHADFNSNMPVISKSGTDTKIHTVEIKKTCTAR